MNSFLSGLILFSSFAMRTPNDDTIKKDDYELSVGFKSKTIYYKRDWERELAVNYIDEEALFVFEPNGLPLYMKPQYVNKTSRDLRYGNSILVLKRIGLVLGIQCYIQKIKLNRELLLVLIIRKKLTLTLI